MSSQEKNVAGLPPIPVIERLLDRLRRRLVIQVWMHGLGRILMTAGLLLLLAFAIDWILHVPSGVRVVNFVLLLGLPSLVAWRELFARVRCVPDRDGLAVLIERAHPELHELLVSAVQLSSGKAGPGDGDPELIAAVIRQAEERAAALELAKVTDPGPSRLALAVGTACALATAATLILQAEAAGVFLARIAGGSTRWPQRTHLSVEVPLAGEVHASPTHLELSVARGSDVPVLVRAEGTVPEEVTVHFAGGHQVVLAGAGRDVFRTLLRSVQEDVAFQVTGGDDTDGTPSVAIQVLQPPDVAGIAVRVVPPAYSGLAERLVFDSDVQVLTGSEITVHLLPDPLDAVGIARILPEDRELELAPRPYPSSDETLPEANAFEGSVGLAFDFIAEESLRYRFELTDSTGLSNPDPGLFTVHVEADRAPELTLVAPARGEVETVLGGTLSLKATAFDDFGLSRLSWTWRGTGEDESEARSEVLEARPLGPEELPASKRARAARFAARRIDVNALFGAAPLTEGETFEVHVLASDNREPESQEGKSATVRIRVVSADEFLRRIQDRLARVRVKVDALATLMREKQGYTLDLISSLESDEPDAADASGIGTALSGARRVQGDSRAVARELASVAESLIFSGLDERAGPMLDELEKRLLPITDRGFHPEPWIELAELHREGRIGQADFADQLVEIVGVALAISEGDTLQAIEGLRGAQDAGDLTASYDELLRVSALQSDAASKVEELLTLLSKWDSYQSLLSSTRDLLNRSRNLLDRTRKYYKDN